MVVGNFPLLLLSLDLAYLHWGRKTFVVRDFTAVARPPAHVIRMKIFQMSYGGVIGKIEIYGFGRRRPRRSHRVPKGAPLAEREREKALQVWAKIPFPGCENLSGKLRQKC